MNEAEEFAVLMDILQDKEGKVENEVRQKIELAEDAFRELFKDPEMTMGEAALAMAMLLPAEHLAWYVTVLIRDRVEFGA